MATKGKQNIYVFIEKKRKNYCYLENIFNDFIYSNIELSQYLI